MSVRLDWAICSAELALYFFMQNSHFAGNRGYNRTHRVMTAYPDWEDIYEYLKGTMKAPLRERRIRGVVVNPANHWQPKMHIEVGKFYSDLEYGAPEEQVLAIFESTVFYVCTPTRGGGKGCPYLFAKEDVKKVAFFED